MHFGGCLGSRNITLKYKTPWSALILTTFRDWGSYHAISMKTGTLFLFYYGSEIFSWSFPIIQLKSRSFCDIVAASEKDYVFCWRKRGNVGVYSTERFFKYFVINVFLMIMCMTLYPYHVGMENMKIHIM